MPVKKPQIQLDMYLKVERDLCLWTNFCKTQTEIGIDFFRFCKNSCSHWWMFLITFLLEKINYY